MQSTYSWMGTNIHLVLDDEIANAFNTAQKAFFAAQQRVLDETGTPWGEDPTQPLYIEWTEEQMRVWNTMGDLINKMVELNGGSLAITEEDMKSDYLVKL